MNVNYTEYPLNPPDSSGFISTPTFEVPPLQLTFPLEQQVTEPFVTPNTPLKLPNISFNRSLLRGNMGITDPRIEAHHLIPHSLKNHELVRLAGNFWDINGQANGIGLPTTEKLGVELGLPYHSGGHPINIEGVNGLLDIGYVLLRDQGFLTSDAAAELLDQIAYIRYHQIRRTWLKTTMIQKEDKMYYVFRDKKVTYNNQYDFLQAEIIEPYPNFELDWFDTKYFKNYKTTFVFAINAEAPRLDNYWTGTVQQLFSKKLLLALEKVGVKVETFPTVFIDKQTGITLPTDHKVCHLLEKYPAMDTEQTILNRFGIDKLVLIDDIYRVQKPFFRLMGNRPLILIHQSFKSYFDSIGITGCEYIPIAHFRYPALKIAS